MLENKQVNDIQDTVSNLDTFHLSDLEKKNPSLIVLFDSIYKV